MLAFRRLCWRFLPVENKRRKQEGSAGAWPVAAPMPKLESLLENKGGYLDWCFYRRTFFRWVGRVFITCTVPDSRVARTRFYWMIYFLPLSKEILMENGCL